MCCFSPVFLPVTFLGRLFGSAPRMGAVHVSGTRIFARMVEPGTQALAYQMRLTTPAPVAMVLPLPTDGSADAVTFIGLDGYPDLLDAITAAFFDPLGEEVGQPKGFGVLRGGAPKLEVIPVGDFVASFVPTVKDFDRLDERFRLPQRVWDALPRYADYGFAVFQLGEKHLGKQNVHPMAFKFRTREPGSLFFPTVHVHDGAVHPTAHFDHALIAQGAELGRSSHVAVEEMVNLDKAKGIVAPGKASRSILRGMLPNEDQRFPLAEVAS